MDASENPHLSIQSIDGLISITLDKTTADYLRYAIAVLGEHIAAGLEIPPMSADMANKLGRLMNEIEGQLRAH